MNRSLNQSTSKQTSKPPQENHVRVVNSALLDDLLQAAEYPPPRQTSSQTSSESPRDGGGEDRDRDQIRSMQKFREEEFQRQFEKARRDAERRLKESRKRREHQFQELWGSLMEEKNGLVAEIDEYLKADDANSQRHREELYRRWCEEVFDPIQLQIQNKVDSISIVEIEARRLAMFEKFIQASNKKALFRDIIIESEYDPLELAKQNTIKYTPAVTSPPVSARVTPRGTVSPVKRRAPFADPSPPVGVREMLDIKHWTHAEATPHGHFAKEDPSVPPKVKTDPVRQSHVMFDHYAYPKGKEPLAAENPPGRKVFPEWRPKGRTNDPIL